MGFFMICIDRQVVVSQKIGTKKPPAFPVEPKSRRGFKVVCLLTGQTCMLSQELTACQLYVDSAGR